MQGLPRRLSGEESSCQCRRPRFNPLVRKIPWRRKWQLQYSCLGNPMIRSAWRAAGHGFRERQTRPSSRAHTHVQGGNGSAFAPRTVTAQLRSLASFLSPYYFSFDLPASCFLCEFSVSRAHGNINFLREAFCLGG